MHLANYYIQHVQKYRNIFMKKKKKKRMFLVFEPMQEKRIICLISGWIQNTIKIYLFAIYGPFRIISIILSWSNL